MTKKFAKVKTSSKKIAELEKQLNYKKNLFLEEKNKDCCRITITNLQKDSVEQYCITNNKGATNKSFLTLSFSKSADCEDLFYLVSNGEYTGTLGVIPLEYKEKIRKVFECQHNNKYKILFDYFCYFKNNLAEIVIIPLN